MPLNHRKQYIGLLLFLYGKATQRNAAPPSLVEAQAMGNDVHRNAGKRHYDITMSRRTRKPLNVEESKEEILLNGDGYEGEKRKAPETGGGGGGGHDYNDDHKKSLKQLLIHHGDGNVKAIQQDEGNKYCRSTSLGQHFTEEKQQRQQLQLVVKHQHEEVIKPKGSFTHYIKFLSHLIKVHKQESRAASSPN